MLPKEAITEFIDLYRKRFSIELTEKEAFEKASNLFGLYKAVYDNPVTNLDSQKL